MITTQTPLHHRMMAQLRPVEGHRITLVRPGVWRCSCGCTGNFR